MVLISPGKRMKYSSWDRAIITTFTDFEIGLIPHQAPRKPRGFASYPERRSSRVPVFREREVESLITRGFLEINISKRFLPTQETRMTLPLSDSYHEISRSACRPVGRHPHHMSPCNRRLRMMIQSLMAGCCIDSRCLL